MTAKPAPTLSQLKNGYDPIAGVYNHPVRYLSRVTYAATFGYLTNTGSRGAQGFFLLGEVGDFVKGMHEQGAASSLSSTPSTPTT